MASTLIGGLGRLVDFSCAVPPYDSQSGAKTGKRFCMQDCGGVMVVIFKAAGIAGDDPTFTLQEATAYTGGTTQNLAAITAYAEKSETALDGDEAWTVTTQSAAATLTDATWAEKEAIIVFDVKAGTLSDNYTHILVNYADTGSGGTQPMAVLYVPYDLKVQRAPANMPNWLRPGAANA